MSVVLSYIRELATLTSNTWGIIVWMPTRNNWNPILGKSLLLNNIFTDDTEKFEKPSLTLLIGTEIYSK